MTNPSIERHFNIVLGLMLFFFVIDMVMASLVGLGYTHEKIGNGLAHDAFLQCFGITMGIFRGMIPDTPTTIKLNAV